MLLYVLVRGVGGWGVQCFECRAKSARRRTGRAGWSIVLRCAALLFITENMVAWGGTRSSTSLPARACRVNNSLRMQRGKLVPSLPVKRNQNRLPRGPYYAAALTTQMIVNALHSRRAANSEAADATRTPRVFAWMLYTCTGDKQTEINIGNECMFIFYMSNNRLVKMAGICSVGLKIWVRTISCVLQFIN